MPKNTKQPFLAKLLRSYLLIFRWPFLFLTMVCFIAFYSFGISQAWPCGSKYVGQSGHAIHGVCHYSELQGETIRPFRSPTFVGEMVAAIVLVLWPISVWNETSDDLILKNARVDLLRSLRKSYQRTPKWRKRARPIAYAISYIAVVTLLFRPNPDAGYHWYNYFAQYILVAPLLALLPVPFLLSAWRKLTK